MENEHEEEEEEYEHEEEEEDTPSRPPTLEIGTRVTVYWSDDDQWYKEPWQKQRGVEQRRRMYGSSMMMATRIG